MRELMLEAETVPTPNPAGDADALESILDAWHDDAATQVPEFWSWQVLESLSHLFGAIMLSLSRGELDDLSEDSDRVTAGLGEYRAKTKSLLVEIRDLLDQLWWADWPAISTSVERDLRSLLVRVRENEAQRRQVLPG